MRLRSLFGSAFLLLAVLFAFTQPSFSQSEDFPSDRMPDVGVYDHGGTSLDIDGVQVLDLVTPGNDVSTAQSVKILPVADGISRYEARKRAAYWPRTKASKIDTKGYSWLMRQLIVRELQKAV